MKTLGIDYGTKRVGIALSDEGGSFAFPKEIVAAAEALSRVEAIVREERISEIVIGHSVASNAVENEVVEAIKKFTEQLSKRISLPIHHEREDFSSVEAHRYQTKAGNRDDSAAAIILQRFLDKRKK